jgi:hypothetical protein
MSRNLPVPGRVSSAELPWSLVPDCAGTSPRLTLHGKCLPVVWRDHTRIAFTAGSGGDRVVAAFDGVGTQQVIERCQARRTIGYMQQGEITGRAIRDAGQHVENLPAQQVLHAEDRLARGRLQQMIIRCEGRPAAFIIRY